MLPKKAEELKIRMVMLESTMHAMQDTIGKVLQLSKDTRTNVGKLHIAMDGVKLEDVRSFNKLLEQIDSLKIGADSSNNDLTVSVNTSYSNFSKNVNHSYNCFYRNILKTLKYFLGDRWFCYA